jgi:hypothetical protein
MIRPATLGLLTALALGVPVVAAPAAAPTAAPSADASSYAQREKQDPQVANYQGGDVLVIGLSGGALVVLLIILLLV